MNYQLPPPFKPGESYMDRDGVFTVLAVEGSQLLFERPSGERSHADAEIKARIHRNIVAEGEHGAVSKGTTGSRPRAASRYSLSEVLPIVAATIRALGKESNDYVTHDEIVEALVDRRELSSLLERLEANDPGGKTKDWFASNILQWFSQQITSGTSDWQTHFDRRKVDSKWAYRTKESTSRR